MPNLVILKNFRLVDESTDCHGSVVVEGGLIREVLPEGLPGPGLLDKAALVLDGRSLAAPESGPALLMPAFVDLHAHFRDSAAAPMSQAGKAPPLPSELLESASMAAVAGGFGTVVCMANTSPVIDTPEKAAAVRQRAGVLGLVDLYPALSLTKGMEGKELSGLPGLAPRREGGPDILMLSEDGKDVTDDALFLKAMAEARRLSIPISCHCDFGGSEAEEAKNRGEGRKVWSRIEENNAVRRVIELGKQAGCHIHIAHVSTKEAAECIQQAKKDAAPGFTLTCEAMPHNLCLTEEDAEKMGAETYGRVNPPLRAQADREALKTALLDGTVDAIATDHAPHAAEAKAKGAPGFSGLETAFAAAFTELTRPPASGAQGLISLKKLSSLMSANPARLLGLWDRGRLEPGCRADLVIVNSEASWLVDPEQLKTRGKNSPFSGRRLYGKILMTLRLGRIAYHA